jgi:polar amino acid transport system substrate-binding protein
MKFRSILAAISLSVAAFGGAQAETMTFAVGEWAPYIGQELPNDGVHTERVRAVMQAAGYDLALEYLPW